jgi:hypothetical protein
MSGPKVYEAISSVMATMAKEGIGKSRKNAQQGYAFRGIDDIYNALARVLSDAKLVMLPFVQTVEREERQTKSGGALNYTILTVDFKLVSAEDGSHDTIRMVGEAMDSADKSSNKAQSAALKYAALQVFMIPTEGDNDADATTHEVAARQQPVKRKPEPLSGKPYKTRAEARVGYGNIVRELHACGDADQLAAYLGTIQDELMQFRNELPDAWAGDGGDFLGLDKEIKRMEAEVGGNGDWRNNPLLGG